MVSADTRSSGGSGNERRSHPAICSGGHFRSRAASTSHLSSSEPRAWAARAAAPVATPPHRPPLRGSRGGRCWPGPHARSSTAPAPTAERSPATTHPPPGHERCPPAPPATGETPTGSASVPVGATGPRTAEPSCADGQRSGRSPAPAASAPTTPGSPLAQPQSASSPQPPSRPTELRDRPAPLRSPPETKPNTGWLGPGPRGSGIAGSRAGRRRPNADPPCVPEPAFGDAFRIALRCRAGDGRGQLVQSDGETRIIQRCPSGSATWAAKAPHSLCEGA
jgi:hypothetical protein